MAELPDEVGAGHYAREQIQSRDPLIAWSHGRRFQTALALGAGFAGKRVLDYGCGDGTFLALLSTGPAPPALGTGAEIYPSLVDDCRRRFAGYPALRFTTVDDLRQPGQAHSYDALFCMEVLEHVVDAEPLLAECERLLAPGGQLVVSVPIETGLPLVVKQIVRRVAGWRGIGYYPGTTTYAPWEFVKSLLASSTQHIERPVFRRDDDSLFHDHKGFNWRVLRGMVASRFDLVRTLTSPVSWLGPQFGTQIWFVARSRAPRSTE